LIPQHICKLLPYYREEWHIQEDIIHHGHHCENLISHKDATDIDKLKYYKSPGTDLILAELIQVGTSISYSKIHKLTTLSAIRKITMGMKYLLFQLGDWAQG
jgi:hypothetical protein